jgi:flagellar basal body-associated protein FliL
MSKTQIQKEMRTNEAKLLGKYSFWSKLFILIIILLVILLSIVFLGVYLFGYAHNWALLSLDVWIILISLLCVIFIFLELYFYYNLSSVIAKRVELETPKPEFIDGKLVFIFTYPKGSEGGVFSKTYIEIDKKNILRIRSLIVPPDELWGNKEI